MKEKNRFTTPSIEIVLFEEHDIIFTSGIAGENWSEYPDKEDWND